MSMVQQELNDFLQCELYHTLGSYGAVAKRLHELNRRLMRSRRRATDSPLTGLFPNDIVAHACRYNERLRAVLHQPTPVNGDEAAAINTGSRHPKPDKRLDGGDVRDRWVLDFYATALESLEAYKKHKDGGGGETSLDPTLTFGRVLSIVHDPQRRTTDLLMPIEGRIERNRHRLANAKELLEREGKEGRSREIVCDYLGNPDQDQLHTHALGALVDAHICMHSAEHLMAMRFGEKMENRREHDRKIKHELNRSLVMNTFVYVVGRAVPWIFAENDEERAYVVDNYERCCERLSPTYCMWIGSQLSLLALHRRAFTYLLMGKPNMAYNDFHKLRRFARNVKQQLDTSLAHVPGARAFLTGLDAFADHHSGRIYRGQHAHTIALQHLNRAAQSLSKLERDPESQEMQEMLRNSRWRIGLLMSQGKANYELGQVKRCLRCFARAWLAFLELANTESLAVANFEIVKDVIDWLGQVDADAEIDKCELKRRMEPLVDQLCLVRGPAHLRVLAAEIMMRIGHVLFVLRLPLVEGDKVVKRDSADGARLLGGDDEPGNDKHPKIDRRLAHRCLFSAAQLDPANTLIAADLRKFDYWKGSLDKDKEGNPLVGGEPNKLKWQWPGGSGDFEEAARIVEYVLQGWLSETNPDPTKPEDDRDDLPSHEVLARRLLSAFLLHTDSTNVKLAQIYRYLMKERTRDRRVLGASWGPPLGVEFVCLRRYSSFFPFVPRPSAFPVRGGGYFVRVNDPDRGHPFGVVIDPGPHLINNLYRCGYCLDDVHMVVVTHDHADHIAALDALLALLAYRRMYGADTFDEQSRLAIVGNESVYERYRFFNKPGRPDQVSVWTFEEWEEMTARTAKSTDTPDEPDGELAEALQRFEATYKCRSMRLRRVRTVEHKDAGGHLAQGFLLSAKCDDGGRTKILFTSDTGVPPEVTKPAQQPDRDVPGQPVSLVAALHKAHMVVAHVSSAPLPELRSLAGFDDAPTPAAAKETKEFEDLWLGLCKQVATAEAIDDEWSLRPRFLLKQVQAGFHSRPDKKAQDSSSGGLGVSPLSPRDQLKDPSEKHLYMTGLIAIAERMGEFRDRPRLLLVGELREELGTFRTRIASALNNDVLKGSTTTAMTADIGLQVHLHKSAAAVLCATCDLDNDLVESERFHPPEEISEVCVKGENEGVFYNCAVHEPLAQPRPVWIERVERYDPFGH